MMAAFRSGKTTVELAAIEPHVINLVTFLQSIGVDITVGYNHKITVNGTSDIPLTAETTVIHDYIESGTFVVL